MNLSAIVDRKAAPEPWTEGEKIPWNDPDFSRRMLREHLDQSHDMASRRSVKIESHIRWIHDTLLGGKSSRILDLCCGPGFYTVGLSAKGHVCRGIDFSPASVEYARTIADAAGVSPAIELKDIRDADFGSGYDLVMLIFGEFNVFKRDEAIDILHRAYNSLMPGGIILLEPTPYSSFVMEGPVRKWWTAKAGLFSDEPHLVLSEKMWDEGTRTTTDRFYVIIEATGEVTSIAASAQAYTDDEYRELLRTAGFGEISFTPSLSGTDDPEQPHVFVVTGKR